MIESLDFSRGLTPGSKLVVHSAWLDRRAKEGLLEVDWDKRRSATATRGATAPPA